MTALPVMWYALFDFEYEKERPEQPSEEEKNKKYLMNDPELYELGLNNECFSVLIFL